MPKKKRHVLEEQINDALNVPEDGNDGAVTCSLGYEMEEAAIEEKSKGPFREIVIDEAVT